MVDDEETVIWQVGGVFVKMDRTHDGEIVGFADTAQRGDERAVYGLRVVGRVVWVVVTSGDQTFRQQQYPCMVACRFAGEPADDADVVPRLFRYGELPDRHFHVSHCDIVARVEVGQVKGIPVIRLWHECFAFVPLYLHCYVSVDAADSSANVSKTSCFSIRFTHVLRFSRFPSRRERKGVCG